MKKVMKAVAALMLMTAVVCAAGCHKVENNNFEVKVTTYTPYDITQTTAVCGGEAIVKGNGSLLELGICWATTQNPTTSDNKLSTNDCDHPFSETIANLVPNTTYHVRAYAKSGSTYYYGEDKVFTTLEVSIQPTLPVVQTSEVTEVTATTAIVGGAIINDGNGTITECGICYKNGDEEWTCIALTANDNAFSMILENLTQNTTYIVRAYATNEAGTGYGEEVAFTTESGDDGGYVDLGLPSGLLWATCNLGADTPEGYGIYFAWAETEPKTNYTWITYKYCNGNYNQLTKYCNSSNYGYNGYTDNLTILLPVDDPAIVNNGGRTPTKEDWEELLDYCSSVWTMQNGRYGRRFTGSNGYSIFFPAAGRCWGDNCYSAGGYGYYWSSSLYIGSPDSAYYFYFDSGSTPENRYEYRSYGFSVRLVRDH